MSLHVIECYRRKEDACHWLPGKTSGNGPTALTAPQQETKAWRIPVILKVMLWLKEGQGRMVILQFHNVIAF